MKMNKAWVADMKQLIANGKTERVIQIFMEKANENEDFKTINDQLILISNRLKEFKRKERMGVLPIYDNSLQSINLSILDLLNEVECYRLLRPKKYEKPIKRLRQRLLLAKNLEELKRIKFEIEKEMQNNSHDYDMFELHEMVSKSLDWELNRKKHGDSFIPEDTESYLPPNAENYLPSLAFLILLFLFLYLLLTSF